MAIKDRVTRLLGLDAVQHFNIHGNTNPKEKTNALLESLHYQLIQRHGVIWYDYCSKDYIKEYQHNAEVYTIIRKIVDTVNLAPLYLYVDNGDDKSYKYKSFKKDADRSFMYSIYREKALEFANGSSPLQKLLDKPNPHQTWRELNILFDIFYFSQGEAFLYRDTPLESDIATSLYVAPANLMSPVFGGSIEEPLIGWEIDLLNGGKRLLDAKDVFHLKFENPNYDSNGSQFRGQSPLLAGLKHLKLNDASLAAYVSLQENEGVKGIAFQDTDNPAVQMAQDKIEQVQELWNQRINDKSKRGQVALGNSKLGYINFGVSAETMKLIEALNYTGFKLCQLWGIDPMLFSSDAKYDNKQIAYEQFIKQVVLPYQTKKEEALNRWLTEPFSRKSNQNFVLDYDTSIYPELSPSKEQKEWLKSICSVNEMRIIEGYDTIDNPAYNSVLVNAGIIMLDDLGTDIDIDLSR